MNDVLKELVGKQVEVHSMGAEALYRDSGRLVSYDERWVVIEKVPGEMLYLSIVNVRLIKPIG